MNHNLYQLFLFCYSKRGAKMATKGKRPMRALTPGDKIEAIQRVNDGESKASVARDIGVPESTLRGWCKNEDKLRYMTSRLSSPDTDKSNDGEPPDKRARTESPVEPTSPAPSGLDLTAPPAVPTSIPQPTPPVDVPVELTTRRSEPSPTLPQMARERRPDPGASVSMSAISPLSGLGHIPGLTHSHLGLSFNEIANNLTFLAQLNPGLSALSAQPASRALRSVRSPKPAHNGVLNLNEPKHRSKPHHHSDPYRHSSSKSSHHSTPSSAANQPVDETLWYWLKTQQAMLDLTAQTTTAHSLQLGKSDPTLQPKPISATTPINSHLDYNRNSWLWQYYKQFGGAMPLPEDKHKSAAQVPKDKTAENILYSHLTKGKEDDHGIITHPMESKSQIEEPRQTSTEEPRVAEPATSPELGAENKEPLTERSHDSGKSQTKARTVLDNLLFNNTSPAVVKETKSENMSNGEWESNATEALEHGDKFLAWLEASGDPSVTRMHVHQLRALLHNLRSRRVPVAVEPVDHASRRK